MSSKQYTDPRTEVTTTGIELTLTWETAHQLLFYSLILFAVWVLAVDEQLFRTVLTEVVAAAVVAFLGKKSL
jgi:hypothetical protein